MNYSLLHRIAGAGPWLGPVPSAFFIGRSIYLHLLSDWQGGTVKVPPAANLAIAGVCGLVVELLAIVSIHNALALYRWNHTPRVAKDKGGWERAPLWVALFCTGLYIGTAALLLVVLEAWPQLAQYAPILFPLLAVVGALNLAILDQHQDRLERYGLAWDLSKQPGSSSSSRGSSRGSSSSSRGSSSSETAAAQEQPGSSSSSRGSSRGSSSSETAAAQEQPGELLTCAKCSRAFLVSSYESSYHAGMALAGHLAHCKGAGDV